MTANNFRDLLDPWTLFVADDGHSGLRVANPDDLLALPVPWVDCPTCCQAPHPRKRGCKFTPRNMMVGWSPCPACHGTGKATVAQLLAWGQAAAQPLTSEWCDHDFPFEAVDDYRNRILDTLP